MYRFMGVIIQRFGHYPVMKNAYLPFAQVRGYGLFTKPTLLAIVDRDSSIPYRYIGACAGNDRSSFCHRAPSIKVHVRVPNLDGFWCAYHPV